MRSLELIFSFDMVAAEVVKARVVGLMILWILSSLDGIDSIVFCDTSKLRHGSMITRRHLNVITFNHVISKNHTWRRADLFTKSTFEA